VAEAAIEKPFATAAAIRCWPGSARRARRFHSSKRACASSSVFDADEIKHIHRDSSLAATEKVMRSESDGLSLPQDTRVANPAHICSAMQADQDDGKARDCQMNPLSAQLLNACLSGGADVREGSV